MDALDRITKLETKIQYLERDITEIVELRKHIRWIERYIWTLLGVLLAAQVVMRFLRVA